MATDSLKADYMISMANCDARSRPRWRRSSPTGEVTATSPLRNTRAGIDGKPQYLTGVNGSSIDQLTSLDFTKGGWSRHRRRQAVVVDTNMAKQHGLEGRLRGSR